MSRPLLVGSDIDGTLITGAERVSPRTRECLRRFIDAGGVLALATGRPPRWLLPVLEQLPVRPMAVCANGAVVFDSATDEVLSARTIGADELGHLAEVIRAALPGYRMVKAYEVTTLTRLPVLDSAWYDLPANHRDVLLTRLRWQGQDLNVVNAHLGTVTVSSLLKGDLARLQRTRTARLGQVKVLERIAVGAGEGALLLGGDLNTPPRGQLYRRMQTAFGPDAHDLAGRGPGWTFPSLKVRIDHVLSRGLTPTRTQVLNVPGSDHLPLLVEYR